jgi:hypothetical protein
MGERHSASGAAMCFFGWGLLKERECNIDDVAGLLNFSAALTGIRTRKL